MSDILTPTEINEIVFNAVKKGVNVRLANISVEIRPKVYPYSQEKRMRAIDRALQRLRKTGRVMYLNRDWCVAIHPTK